MAEKKNIQKFTVDGKDYIGVRQDDTIVEAAIDGIGYKPYVALRFAGKLKTITLDNKGCITEELDPAVLAKFAGAQLELDAFIKTAEKTRIAMDFMEGLSLS